MFSVGGSEIIFILFIILLFFGSKKIPELARGLGKGMREMKDAASGIEREITKEVNDIKEKTDVKNLLDKKD